MKIVITGANRGIGLALTRHFALQDDSVIACCRESSDSSELSALEKMSENISIEFLDVGSDSSIMAFAGRIREQAVDALINNAGTFSKEENGILTVSRDKMMDVFNINAAAPVILVKSLLPNLRKSPCPRVINIISGTGFLHAGTDYYGQYSYAASKSALNMLTKLLSMDPEMKEVTVIGLGPGYVRTDMTKFDNNESISSVDANVPQMVRLVKSICLSDSGNFFEYDGSRFNSGGGLKCI